MSNALPNVSLTDVTTRNHQRTSTIAQYMREKKTIIDQIESDFAFVYGHLEEELTEPLREIEIDYHRENYLSSAFEVLVRDSRIMKVTDEERVHAIDRRFRRFNQNQIAALTKECEFHFTSKCDNSSGELCVMEHLYFDLPDLRKIVREETGIEMDDEFEIRFYDVDRPKPYIYFEFLRYLDFKDLEEFRKVFDREWLSVLTYAKFKSETWLRSFQ